MQLKPWYDVVKPREDLREGKPLDASEFAVHLDKVRPGNAPDDYKIGSVSSTGLSLRSIPPESSSS